MRLPPDVCAHRNHQTSTERGDGIYGTRGTDERAAPQSARLSASAPTSFDKASRNLYA